MMNQLQNDNMKESREKGKLVLEMEKPFSESDVFLFVLKRNYVGIFYFLAFSLPCFFKRKDVDFFSIFIMVLQIWALISVLKTYYIYKFEFKPLSKTFSMYVNYPILRINVKQEFSIIEIKIGRVQYGRGKSDGIVIINSTNNQIYKFSIFDYKYSLKKENVNNFINKINKYL